MAEIINAYSDETGNTGNNIFDRNQPYFRTGTLLSKYSLDEYVKDSVEKCLYKLGVIELHAGELGIGRLNFIAEDIIDIIDNYECNFVFTSIEKRHVARMKFADLILDSHLNPAVSTMHYGVRGLRLPLAYWISRTMSPRTEEEFWNLYGRWDNSGFKRILSRTIWNVENKVPDKRTKELLVDALSWAYSHPEPFSDYKLSELDSPNMVAFSLLIDGLHKQYEGLEIKIERFVHDEQNQFAKSMNLMYEVLRKFSGSFKPLSLATDIKLLDTYGCPLEIVESKKSIGLQLIDVVLWLIKRYIEKPQMDYGNCKRLIETIISRGVISEFSLERLKEELLHIMQDIYSRPCSDEELANGKKLFDEIELVRHRRMKGEE